MEQSTLSKLPSITVHYEREGEDFGKLVAIEASEPISSSYMMSILFGVLVKQSDDFIKDHDPKCDCSALRFYKKISGLGKYILAHGLDESTNL